MLAQFMYDLREQEEFCSGKDLSQFFEVQTGDPSPSGKTEIHDASARAFYDACVEAQNFNNK